MDIPGPSRQRLDELTNLEKLPHIMKIKLIPQGLEQTLLGTEGGNNPLNILKPRNMISMRY